MPKSSFCRDPDMELRETMFGIDCLKELSKRTGITEPTLGRRKRHPRDALPGRVKVPNTEIAMDIEDEDGAEKFKYFPQASSSAFSRSVNSEGDTVAEVEMTFDLSVDEHENIMYEVLKTDLPTTGDLTQANWMTTVSSALLQASA